MKHQTNTITTYINQIAQNLGCIEARDITQQHPSHVCSIKTLTVTYPKTWTSSATARSSNHYHPTISNSQAIIYAYAINIDLTNDQTATQAIQNCIQTKLNSLQYEHLSRITDNQLGITGCQLQDKATIDLERPNTWLHQAVQTTLGTYYHITCSREETPETISTQHHHCHTTIGTQNNE